MDYISELAVIASKHGGIIETKIAAQRGISKAMLYKLSKKDKIHRIVKGQYIFPNDMQDELLSISKRSNRIIFSMKRHCSCMGFQTERSLNTPLPLPPTVFPLRLSKRSAKCITSSWNCSSWAKRF